MGFLKKISELLTSPQEEYSYWIAVKCNRCGEIVRTRVDLRNDISIEYDNGKTTYLCRKVLIGDQFCFQKIEVRLKFDNKRRLIERQISGGEFYDE